MTRPRLALGKWGEEAAASHLQGLGGRVLERNLRTPAGEIDLVVRFGRTLAFVEVKTRRGSAFGLPQEAVTARKRQQIARVAAWYLAQGHGRGLQPRFDVVAVRIERDGVVVEHLPGAFEIV